MVRFFPSKYSSSRRIGVVILGNKGERWESKLVYYMATISYQLRYEVLQIVVVGGRQLRKSFVFHALHSFDGPQRMGCCLLLILRVYYKRIYVLTLLLHHSEFSAAGESKKQKREEAKSEQATDRPTDRQLSQTKATGDLVVCFEI